MSSRSISRTRSGCSSSVRNRSARESKPRRASRQRDEPVPRPPPNFDVWLTGSHGTWVDDEAPSAKHSRSGTLGPTWDPHGVHEGKRRARHSSHGAHQYGARTCRNGYPHLLGVKESAPKQDQDDLHWSAHSPQKGDRRQP